MPCDLLDGRVMDQDIDRRTIIQRPYPNCGWYELISCRQQISIIVESYRRDPMSRAVRLAQG